MTEGLILEQGKLPRPFTWAGPLPTLGELQAAVGGYIEMVSVPGDSSVVMIVDEEGLLKKKPPNYMASILADQQIVGTVVVVPREVLTSFTITIEEEPA